MKDKKLRKEGRMKRLAILAVAMFVVSMLLGGNVKAYETITAWEVYEAGENNPEIINNGAYFIDVRTTAEFLWVGTCKLPDGSTPWNIPWKIWTNTVSETDGKVKAGGIVVKELFLSLVKRTFPEGSILVLMCRSGHRSTDAAKYLEEQLGEDYYTIYEIDNPLKNAENGKGGSGGFQGSSSVDPNDKGYRGYPERLPFCSETTEHPCVARYGSEIADPSDSVSWMDSGLPITQTVDKDKIWLYMGE